MDIFSIDVTHNELTFLRQSLDVVSVSGKDAKFLALGLRNLIRREDGIIKVTVPFIKK